MLMRLLFVTMCMAAPVLGDDVHPIFPPEHNTNQYNTTEAFQSTVAPLMAMSEQDMLALVPEQNGFIFCGCPNCDGGVQELGLEWAGPSDPDHVKCRSCEMVFPNDRYPMTESFEVADRLGNVRTWRYHKGADGNEYFFVAKARYQAKHYMGSRSLYFATLYAVTGEKKYARRAALILHRLAECYPAWNVMNDYPAPGQKFVIEGDEVPKAYQWTGLWYRWWYADIPGRPVRAYDLIRNSGEIERLAEETGDDVKRRIEQDFFDASVQRLLRYPKTYDNMSPYVYDGMIMVGRIIGKPEYVHEGVARAVTLFETQFFIDGMWNEGSPGYHRQTIGAMRTVLDHARGYSDPLGYAAPDGSRFDDLDLATRFPIIGRAQRVPLLMTYPDGKEVPVHDSWAHDGSGYNELTDGSMLLYDYGHARLGFFEGAGGFQSHLHFSSGFGHRHYDDLSMILFAKGQELLVDIGYSTSRLRFYTTYTPGHNTVVIDETNTGSAPHAGNIQLLAMNPNHPVQAIEAAQPTAYPALATDYRRRLITVRVGNDDAYLLDIFHVAGGAKHDYFLHGSAWHPQNATINLPLSETPDTLLGVGVEYELPTSATNWAGKPEDRNLTYACFRDLREATTGDTFEIDWQFDDSQINGCLRSTLLGQADSRVVLARTPQVRPIGPGSSADESKLDDYWRPSVCVRREGDAPLRSTFVAVQQPYVGETFINGVESLRRDDAVVAVRVTHTAGRDTIISQSAGATIAIDDITTDALLAVVRRTDDGVVFAWMIGGTTLRCGDVSLQSPGAWRGDIAAVERDPQSEQYRFTTSAPPPPPEVALADAAILVTHGDGTVHAYRIRAVSRDGDATVIELRDDPGFTIDGNTTRFISYPQRGVEGDNTFTVLPVVMR